MSIASTLGQVDQALFELYRKGVISMEEALSSVDSRSNLEARGRPRTAPDGRSSAVH